MQVDPAWAAKVADSPVWKNAYTCLRCGNEAIAGKFHFCRECPLCLVHGAHCTGEPGSR